MSDILNEIKQDVKDIKHIVIQNRDEEVQRIVAVETRSKTNRWMIMMMIASIGTYVGKLVGLI